MAIYTSRAVVYLDVPTRRELSRLAENASVPSGVYIRKLVELHVAGDSLPVAQLLTTLDKVWIAVDALLKTQTWDPALRGTVRDIIERRVGRTDA